MIRIANHEDAGAIASILTRSIREVCGSDYGNDEELLAYWCANKTPENMRRGVENPNNYWIVAEESNNLAGTALLSMSGEILLCYLLPEYLGHGIGKAMLNELIRYARVLGIRKMTLESTRTARDFYKHNGFVELDETECMGRIPGFRMERDITI